MPANSRRANFLSALLGALVIAVLFGVLAVSGTFDDDESSGSTPAAVQPSGDDGDDGDESEAPSGEVTATNVAPIYESVRPSVVSVETRQNSGSPLGGGGGGGSGSGFIVDQEGFILTNDHVVEGADSVRVRFDEGGPVAARVVSTDPSTDLALIKVSAEGRELEPLALGSSSDAEVGQPAIALGSPFGLDGTLTTGVISALERSIQAPNRFTIDNVIQTDAAINPGNSGGPLLDVQGRVIGVNAQIATDSQSNSGVGFAIPIDTAKEILPQLRSGEEIERPYLGVSTTQPPSGTGALVAEVVEGGPADDAGLRAGDRIVSIDGEEVDSDEVASQVTANMPGDEIRIALRRGDDTRTETVTLGTRPARAPGRTQPPQRGEPGPEPAPPVPRAP